jgi:hypothetical protein
MTRTCGSVHSASPCDRTAQRPSRRGSTSRSRVKETLADQDASPATIRTLASTIHIELRSHAIHLTSSDNCDLRWTFVPPSAPPPPRVSAPKSPPPPLPPGSSAWDQAYLLTSGYGDGWMCPHLQPDPSNPTFVVSKGRFSIPYIIKTTTDEPLTVATIDGSVAANGKATLRVVFVDKLPPESIAVAPSKEHTLDELRGAVPLTMKFEKGDGTQRYAKLTNGPKCVNNFQNTSTFKSGHADGRLDGAQCSRDTQCRSLHCVSGTCVAR